MLWVMNEIFFNLGVAADGEVGEILGGEADIRQQEGIIDRQVPVARPQHRNKQVNIVNMHVERRIERGERAAAAKFLGKGAQSGITIIAVDVKAMDHKADMLVLEGGAGIAPVHQLEPRRRHPGKIGA